MSRDEVSKATDVLLTTVYCRKTALALTDCMQHSGLRGCERQRAAFITCSEERVGLAVDALTKVANKHCSTLVERYHDCKQTSLGSDCEAEDLAAMRCASRRVLESVRR